jgi:magnesium-transporting ATPase (P-type)
MSTEMGKISSAVQEAQSSKTKTPLTKSLDEFSDHLTKAVALICAAVWLVNIPRFSAPRFGVGYEGWLKGSLYYFKVGNGDGVCVYARVFSMTFMSLLMRLISVSVCVSVAVSVFFLN